MIEVEIRTFISEREFDRLLKYLSSHGERLEHTRQITHYLEHPIDTRIQISAKAGKVWQKLGKMHDSSRQELEVNMSTLEARIMSEIFLNLGFTIKVSWYRERRSYQVGPIIVSLDDTVGYGRILEAEIQCEPDKTDASFRMVELFLRDLGLTPATKEELDEAFSAYLKTWSERTSHLNEGWIHTDLECEQRDQDNI